MLDLLIEGMGRDIDLHKFYPHKMTIKPCTSCWTCWTKTPGTYIQNDDYHKIYDIYIFNKNRTLINNQFLSIITSGDWTAKKIDPDTDEETEWVYGRSWPQGNDGYNFFGMNDVVEEHEELSAIDIGVIVSNMEVFVKDYVNNWEVWVRGVTETQP